MGRRPALVDQPLTTTTELVEVESPRNISPGSREAKGKTKFTLSPPIKRHFAHLARVTI